MASVNIKVNLITKAAEIELARFNAALRGTQGELIKTQRTAKGFGTDLSASFRQSSLALGQFGTILRAGAVGAGLFAVVGAVQKTVSELTQFESALIRVGKTTGLSGVPLEQLGIKVLQLAQRIPVASSELLDLAATAAQLGITGTENLLKFAEVGARLGRSTNVGADQAVSALSRLINITRGSQGDIDRLGSSLVELGNNFNGTESDILTAAERVSTASASFNLTGEQVLAISTALVQAGVNAEAGGTAVGKFFRTLETSLIKNNPALKEFQKVIGETGDQLKVSLEKEPDVIFRKFVEGLGRIRASGGSVVTTLVNLGLSADRTSATLSPLAKISNDVTRAFETSSKAFKENVSLFNESNAQFKSVQSSIDGLANAFNAIFINIGKLNKGVIKDFVDGLRIISQTIADGFASDPITDFQDKIRQLKGELKSIDVRIDQSFGEERNKLIVQEIDLTRQLREQRRLLAEATGATQETPENDLNKEKDLEDKRLTAMQEAELKRQELRTIFTEARMLAIDEENMLIDERQLVADDANFLRLEQGLGQAEALRVLARSQQLINEGKHAAAVKIVRDNLTKADEIAAKKRLELEKVTGEARVDLVGNLGSLINAVAGKQTVAGVALQKAAAIAQIHIQSALARGAAVGQTAAIPYPANLAALAQLQGLITTNEILSIGTVIASAVKGFQDGGVVGGASFAGDNVLARVNSGEMILNRQQQAQLFNIANGQGAGPESTRDIVVHTSVQLNEREIARAVSRQVADGAVLGELE